MPEQERKRKLFVLRYLATGDNAEAASYSGLTPQHTRKRIAKHLEDYGTLSEAPHTRTSPKFTEDVMKAALDYYKEDPDRKFPTHQLVSYLVREGLLEEPVDEQNFRHWFEEWLRPQGMTLRVGCRKLIFDITPAKAAERLKFVQDHLSLVDTPEKLQDIIIVDETIYEEGTHPKGTSGVCGSSYWMCYNWGPS
jgi:hypothetical protein